MKIEGKKIVITGATSGIGLELLNLLKYYKTSKIIAVGRNIENIKINENIRTIRCDISKKEELDNLFDYLNNKIGKIDIFIANAGFGIYENCNKANWEKTEQIFKTNVFSPIYSYQKMIETHDKTDEFYFLTTASAMSFFALPYYALYTSSKFAIHGFFEAINYEKNKNIHISLVYPVSTKTNFFNNSSLKNESPIPWPRQNAKDVAKKIIKGIKKNKRKIYPYNGFKWILFLHRILPFILNINLKHQMKAPV